ncbi:kinase-like domain-containing protein [Mycena crocata]|nr:kinase-like domain-containing protein [Mycena crocata]
MSVPLLPPYPEEWPTSRTPEDILRFVTKHVAPAVDTEQRSNSNLPTPWLLSSCATLHRTVVKRPDITTTDFNGETRTNTWDVGTSFARELRFFRTVAPHPNLVRYFGCIDIDGVGLVLEAVDGTELGAIIKQSPPPSNYTKMLWANQLITVILHIHACGLSHGDISPGNVLIDKAGNIKLIDFGRSACVRETLFPATHPFTAPDNAHASHDPSLSDAHALGVLLLCVERNMIFEELPPDEEISEKLLPLFGHLVTGYTKKDRLQRAKIRIEDVMSLPGAFLRNIDCTLLMWNRMQSFTRKEASCSIR